MTFRRPNLVLKSIAFSLLALWSLAIVTRLGLLIPIQRDIVYPEGALVANAGQILQGIGPYGDWTQWPHYMFCYGPLTYYIPVWLLKFFSHTSQTFDLYYSGRIFSFVCIIGLGICAIILSRALHLAWQSYALVFTLLFAWHRPLFEGAVSFRPDAPQVFFSLLSLVAAMVGGGGTALCPKGDHRVCVCFDRHVVQTDFVGDDRDPLGLGGNSKTFEILFFHTSSFCNDQLRMSVGSRSALESFVFVKFESVVHWDQSLGTPHVNGFRLHAMDSENRIRGWIFVSSDPNPHL